MSKLVYFAMSGVAIRALARRTLLVAAEGIGISLRKDSGPGDA